MFLDGTKTGFASDLAISRSFHPLSKVLFIFPSRYLFAIGLPRVFSLGWGIPAVFRVQSRTPLLACRSTASLSGRPYGAFTLYGSAIPRRISGPPVVGCVCIALQLCAAAAAHRGAPRRVAQIPILGSCLFTRRYWGNHCCFLFLRLLICLSPAGDSTWLRGEVGANA